MSDPPDPLIPLLLPPPFSLSSSPPPTLILPPPFCRACRSSPPDCRTPCLPFRVFSSSLPPTLKSLLSATHSSPPRLNALSFPLSLPSPPPPLPAMVCFGYRLSDPLLPSANFPPLSPPPLPPLPSLLPSSHVYLCKSGTVPLSPLHPCLTFYFRPPKPKFRRIQNKALRNQFPLFRQIP